MAKPAAYLLAEAATSSPRLIAGGWVFDTVKVSKPGDEKAEREAKKACLSKLQQGAFFKRPKNRGKVTALGRVVVGNSKLGHEEVFWTGVVSGLNRLGLRRCPMTARLAHGKSPEMQSLLVERAQDAWCRICAERKLLVLATWLYGSQLREVRLYIQGGRAPCKLCRQCFANSGVLIKSDV